MCGSTGTKVDIIPKDTCNYPLLHSNSTIFTESCSGKKQPKYYQVNPEEHASIFFNIPIVKFWTNTMVYLFFLLLQAYPNYYYYLYCFDYMIQIFDCVRYVLLHFKQNSIAPEEYVLWFWVFTMILEEVFEFFSEHSRGITPEFILLKIDINISLGYFSQITNKIDFGIIVSICLKSPHSLFFIIIFNIKSDAPYCLHCIESVACALHIPPPSMECCCKRVVGGKCN